MKKYIELKIAEMLPRMANTLQKILNIMQHDAWLDYVLEASVMKKLHADNLKDCHLIAFEVW
jgi:hypothetical protein